MTSPSGRAASPRIPHDQIGRLLIKVRKGIRSREPIRLVLLGYVLYMGVGWLALSLPIAHAQPVSALDNLFMAVSAVSTTGLVTVDTGTAYSLFGETVILLLIQAGGLGYMTASSFVVLSLKGRFSHHRERMTGTTFSLPADFRPHRFIRNVVLFTLAAEALGALCLFALLRGHVDEAAWSAIFHSVSAFCTAGFSLYSNSFEGFRGNAGVLLIIAALSYLGGIGFIVASEVFEEITARRRKMSFTSKLILKITAGFSIVGTVVLFLAEPTLRSLPPAERLLNAFFQAMTASTTVGFNSIPIGPLAPAVVLCLYVLMVFGASPSGTGGGLKSTTFAVLLATMRSTLKRRSTVVLMNRPIARERVEQASAAFVFYALLVSVGLFVLLLTESDDLATLLFEAISAIGTVGLSMGATTGLTPLGKLVIIVLMTAGRLGILSFGIALAGRDQTPAEQRDNEIVI
jgi:trk/ktr system potassium uptake protein